MVEHSTDTRKVPGSNPGTRTGSDIIVKMSKGNIIIALGVLIALLPVLGFPPNWEYVFQVTAGFLIVLVSVWSGIDKKLTLKAKAYKRQAEKRLQAEIAKKDNVEEGN